MSVTETRVLPPAFIEAAGKTFLGDLASAAGKFKSADLSKVFGPQFVAQKDPLQLEAIKQATAGIGSFQPFLTAAQQATGPQAFQAYMSPYQKDVIDTTLSEFDRQTQKGIPGIGEKALQSGAFGGARQGIAEAEFAAQRGQDRALLQAHLLQQGFGQAQNLAGRQFQQQSSLASLTPALQGQQISGLATLGAGVQQQKQAELAAQQQLAQQQLNQPLQAAQTYGSGVTSLIAGYPGKSVQEMTPAASPISTALGIGSTLAGIYRAVR